MAAALSLWRFLLAATWCLVAVVRSTAAETEPEVSAAQPAKVPLTRLYGSDAEGKELTPVNIDVVTARIGPSASSSTQSGDEGYPPELVAAPRPHSYFLVAVGLGLSLAAFLAMAMLGVSVLAALCDVSVPLLAAVPTSSAALLMLQLLSRMGQGSGASAALVDLGRSLAWALPMSPDTELLASLAVIVASWFARRKLATQRCAEDAKVSEPPHGLLPGAWELRVGSLLAFPLAASATRVLSGDSSWPVLGSAIAAVVLFLLAHHILLALKFVTEVISDGRVVCATLPASAGGGEVFVDRVCNQLRALPVSPPRPGFCPKLVSEWLTSPGWCVAPEVAVIHEVEHCGANVSGDGDLEPGMGTLMQWCGGGEEDDRRDGHGGDLEDELQGRPLLRGGSLDREDTTASVASLEEDAENGHVPGSLGGSPGHRSYSARYWRPSAVNLAHPVRVSTASAFEIRARDLVAGVACIPWLDCAVPAGVLRRIEEVLGEAVVQAHPGQLSGPLSGGRFSACFDWGTRWPWRWPSEVALKVSLGIWAAAPLDAAPGFIAFLLHVLMLGFVCAFLYNMLHLRPYVHRIDNAAIAAASLTTAIIVVLRALGDLLPLFSFALAAVAAIASVVPISAVLLAAMGLASATLDRLEVQGFQDRFLPRTISGWGHGLTGRVGSGAATSEAAASLPSIGSGCSAGGATGVERVADGHSVEVILPGQRKAFAIVLPAITRPRIVHAQFLPPVAGRAGDPEVVPPPCVAPGERARLPVPPSVLFSSSDHVVGSSGSGGTGLGQDSDFRATAPLVALLAPGRPGRLVYSEAKHNDGGGDWREAICGFFGPNGSLLAEEAEKFVEEHALAPPPATSSSSSSSAGAGRVLVVVEVLPAFAAEFMDERHGPP
mmetsp:Transcript_102328/g.257798  ORF Transcript_102328/g.257798 Transcript_102328/m.257798 type:complete len:889 (-) Transcript_102328:95-2761(-)